MAPRSLDVGNMVAHLRRENLRGAPWCLAVSEAAERQFLDRLSGRRRPLPLADLDRWIDVAMLRLAALAATRHAGLAVARQIAACPTSGIRRPLQRLVLR